MNECSDILKVYCRKCGAPKINNAAFCHICGKKCKLHPTNTRRSNYTRLIIVLITMGVICTLSAFLYHAYVTAQKKMANYDLKTASYEKLNGEFYGIYASPTVNPNSEATGIISLSHKYIKAVYSGGFFYISEYGVSEKDNTTLYVKNENNETSEYLMVNNYLLKTDSFYSGEIPPQDTFDSKHTLFFKDGSIIKVVFKEDGTYKYTIAGVTYDGNYTRNGYEIIGKSNNNQATQKWIVYDGKLVNSAFKAVTSITSSKHDWIRYNILLYLQDTLNCELRNSERLFIIQYKNAHPISLGD